MPHALIVDHDPATRDALAAVATAAGFTATACATLAEARLQLARLRPDVALLDPALPDGNGLELFDARALVVVTSKPVDIARVRGMLDGIARRSAPPPPVVPNAISVPLGTSLDDADRSLILATLEYCGGVRKRAADLLGISLKTLYNRLVAYRAQGRPGNGSARNHPIRPEERHAPRHS